jgi:hypothetical protein
MQGAARTGPKRTVCVREDRKHSGNAADGRSWTGSYPPMNLAKADFA